MSNLVKSMIAALALLTGVATSAQAQQGPSVADLPPAGPRASSLLTVPTQRAAIPESPKYIGPAPGSSDASKAAAFQKPAGYDNDVTMYPYAAGMGVKAN